MSDSENSRGGRFVNGGKPGPGRPKGSRNKLSEAFLEDVHASWEKHGAEVLDVVARTEPGTYLRALVALMPRDLNVNAVVANIDTAHTLAAFRQAVALLNNPEPKTLPKIVSIDAKRS